MGTAAPLKTAPTILPFFQMTRDLALSLLHQGTNGDSILKILDTITNDVEQDAIDDCAAHYAAISAQPTAEPIQF